jgi:O-glycosyl hydrolase
MATTTITINRTQPHQTIEGFGVSGAWWAQAIGGWSEPNRQRIIDLLFDPQQGIGLTMYRHNVGGGERGLIDPWRNTQTVETSAGEYDWTRDANALWVLRAARDAGVTDVIIFANSAPGRMTVSGRASGNPGGGSNLLPEMHDAFARYLVDIARHLIEVEGIPVHWISPINEPQWDWQPSKGQEGTHYTTNEIVSVLHALQAQIEAEKVPVDISAAEAGEWSSAAIYARRLFDDPILSAKLDHFAVHSYWSEAGEKAAFVRFMDKNYPQVRLWMSEWTEMREGRDYGMESALVMANTIHDDLTIGGVTSWQYWIGVSKYNFRDGLIYTREHSERIEETKRLWTLGNYSRYVRPGAVRVEATSSDGAVRVSAYLDPATGVLSVIVINNSAEEQTLTFDDPNAAASTVLAYETSEANDLATNNTTTIPPNSVTTFVFTPNERS